MGERLTDEVSWLTIHAAIAVMEISALDRATGGALVKLMGTAQSRPILTKNVSR
ncbi:MAG: hypothetical protein NNA18_08765 [Nitrospira sp.]|nr:hypothetical protein [Nitrospira sp.]